MVVDLILGKKKRTIKNKNMPYNNSPAKKYGPLKMDNSPETETRVKIKDKETGKITMLTKKNGRYYKAGQIVELTPSQSPIEAYGPIKMDHGPKMMGKPLMMKEPALLMKCGSKRYMGKKK